MLCSPTSYEIQESGALIGKLNTKDIIVTNRTITSIHIHYTGRSRHMQRTRIVSCICKANEYEEKIFRWFCIQPIARHDVNAVVILIFRREHSALFIWGPITPTKLFKSISSKSLDIFQLRKSILLRSLPIAIDALHHVTSVPSCTLSPSSELCSGFYPLECSLASWKIISKCYMYCWTRFR